MGSRLGSIGLRAVVVLSVVLWAGHAHGDIDGPRGIYVLGTLNGGQLNNIRIGPNYDFVSGFSMRVKWSDLETAPGIYNFSRIDQAIAQLQPAGKKLTLEVFPSYVPAHVMSQVSQTFVDSRGTSVPVPWDSAASSSWTAFMQAMASHGVLDSNLNQVVPLSSHPTLAVVDAPIVGQQGYRDLTNNLVNHPGYTRTTYINSVLTSVHASRDAFAGKFGFLAAFSMNDSNLASPLDFALRDALMADFNGAGEATLGFFQENLADQTPMSGIPLTRILDTTKDATYTPFQALTSWQQPFANPSAVASGNPATGIDYAYDTWGSTYFELYVADIDAAVNGAMDVNGRPLVDDLRYWNGFLTSTPEPATALGVIGMALLVCSRASCRRQIRRIVISVLLLAAAAPALATTGTVTIFSPSNSRNTSFQIYTPPNYASGTQRYPLVIDLHGIGGTSMGRMNQVVPTLDAAIVGGTVQPMIWVFPDGQTDSFYGNAFDGHKQVYSNVIGEILPYVEANYRTIADRNHRAMSGFSMGGFGAAMYTAKHPELFSAIVEYGGALSKWTDLATFNSAVAADMYNTVEANWLPYSLWDLTDLNQVALRTSVNYKMIVGDADGQQGSNQRFRDHLIALNIDPHYQVLPGVAHVGADYFAQGSGLQFLNNHFATVPEPSNLLAVGVGLLMLKRRRSGGSCALAPLPRPLPACGERE